MTTNQRQQLIESYGQAYEQLRQALCGFPREMWTYKPEPHRWSIHEIMVHLADAEANSYVRCRCFIAEPGKTLMVYDQDLWAARMRYHQQSADAALDVFRSLRSMTYELIRSLPEETWENTVIHPERGVFTFDQWLVIYEEHARKHIDQMRRTFEQWKRSQ